MIPKYCGGGRVTDAVTSPLPTRSLPTNSPLSFVDRALASKDPLPATTKHSPTPPPNTKGKSCQKPPDGETHVVAGNGSSTSPFTPWANPIEPPVVPPVPNW